MGDFLEKFRQARSEMDSGSLSRDISFQGDPFEGQVSVPEYQDPEEQAIINRRLKTGGTLVDAFSLAKRQQEIDALRLKRQTESKAKENLANRSEFTRGLLRGVDTLQATYEGGLGMYNAAMGDQAAANQRFANYQEQMRQAQENPATVTDFFSTDPKTGAFASPGNFGTYVAGTLGQAVPSLTEAVASGIAGAAIGAAIVPAPDPADVVTIPAGAIGGFLGRNAMKRAIASAAQQYAQRGVAQDVAEQMADRYVRQAVANRIATNIGSGLAVSQTTALHEGGGMYAEGLEKGYSAPGTAIALGQFSGLSESLFGAAPTAVKAIIGKAAVDEVAKDFGWKTAAGYLWETIKGAGEEGVQEGFQELLGSINQEINDPNFKINSKETFMQWAEAAAAGAVTGGVVGGGGAGLQAIRDRKRQLEQIRAKGFVSESDAKQAGIEGASRRDRMANLEAERQDLDRQEQEIVGQQQVDGMQVDESGQFVPQVSQADIDREFAERMAAQGGNVSAPAPALPPESVQPPAQQNPFEVPSVQSPQAVPVQQAPGGVDTRGFDVYGQQPSQPSSGNPFEFGAGSTPAGVSDVPASENPFEQPTAPSVEPVAEQPSQVETQDIPLVRTSEDYAAVPMYGVYQTVDRGKKVYGSKVARQYDSGLSTEDGIFDTVEEALADAEQARLFDAQLDATTPAAEQPAPSLTPEQQVESDRQFAEQKAAEQGSIAPQVPVIKQRLKNAVRFAPNTVIPEGVPSVRRTHPVFGDYVEVSTAYVDRIPGYSADIESQGAGVKPSEQQPAQVEAPEVPVVEAKPQIKKGEKPQPKEIGVNDQGQTVFEDENGVRSVLEGDIRTTEPVVMRPTRDRGVVPVVDLSKREDRFKLASEKPSTDQPKPASVEPKAQPAVPKTAAEFEQELTSRVVSRVQSMYDTGNWSELGFMGYLETETDKAFGDLTVEVVESDQLESEVRDFINSFKAPEFAKTVRSKLDEGKPASDKPSEQPETKPTERNMPSYRDWRFKSTARNSGKIVPNKVGAKFLPDQMQSIVEWAKSEGYSVSNVTPTGISVSDQKTLDRLDIAMYGAEGVKAEASKAASEKRKEESKKADEERKAKADSRESADWITSTFGDVINDANRIALSDYVEGVTDKFNGIVSANWKDGLEKLDALSTEGKIDWKKVKDAYVEGRKPAEQPSTDKPIEAEPVVQPEGEMSVEDFVSGFVSGFTSGKQEKKKTVKKTAVTSETKEQKVEYSDQSKNAIGIDRTVKAQKGDRVLLLEQAKNYYTWSIRDLNGQKDIVIDISDLKRAKNIAERIFAGTFDAEADKRFTITDSNILAYSNKKLADMWDVGRAFRMAALLEKRGYYTNGAMIVKVSDKDKEAILKAASIETGGNAGYNIEAVLDPARKLSSYSDNEMSPIGYRGGDSSVRVVVLKNRVGQHVVLNKAYHDTIMKRHPKAKVWGATDKGKAIEQPVLYTVDGDVVGVVSPLQSQKVDKYMEALLEGKYEPSPETPPETKKPRSIKKEPKQGVKEGLDKAKEGAKLFIEGIKDATKGTTPFANIPMNEKIARGLGMMAEGLIEAGKYKFVDFIDSVVELVGVQNARNYARYLEAGWSEIGKTDSRLDKPQSVLKLLEEEMADGQQVYPEGDRADQEGVERSEPDARKPAGDQTAGALEGAQPANDQAAETAGDTRGVRDSDTGEVQQGRSELDVDIQNVDVGGATGVSGGIVDGRGEGFTKPGDGSGIDLAPKSTRPNFHLTDPDVIVGRGLKDKFARNVKALELSQELEESGRPPTQEDLEILASYIGWGAFGQELFQGNWKNPKIKEGWESENEWLREHLGEEEWISAQESIPNAHYTDPEVVSGIWSMIERMGFKGGRFLEPSFGIGNFAALMPRDIMSRTSFTAIELDKATARIAKILYPQINVQQKGYQESKTPNDFYDVTATNVPFGNYKIVDRMYRMAYSIHNYFFRKAIDQTKPGGLMVFVTSSMTMDGKEEAKLLRKQLSDRGDLVAAFRFPTGAFERYAKTKVVADLIIIRKRKPGEQPSPLNQEWTDTVEIETPSGGKIEVNNYWTKHPENVLGILNYGHGTTSGRPGMIVDKPSNLNELWGKAVSSVPKNILNTERAKSEGKERANERKLRQNTVVHQDGELYIAKGEQLLPLKNYVNWYKSNSKESTIKNNRDEIVGLLKIRDALELVLEIQGKGQDASKERAELNRHYDNFVMRYGPITTSKAIGHLKDSGDAIANGVASLEKRALNGEYEKRPIFTRTTVRQPPRVGEKLNPIDAFALARNNSVDIDWDNVAKLAQMPKGEVLKILQGENLIYKTGDETYDSADVFLSGNMARKVRQLEAAKNEGVTGLEKSIDAAKAVMPEPLVYNQIQVGLGAPWITAEDYSQFFADLLVEDVKNTKITKSSRGWKVDFSTSANKSPAVATHGHREVAFSRMVAAAMNNGRVSVFYKDDKGNQIKDEQATIEANVKIDELKDKFKDWIWQSPDRIARLSQAYNEDHRSVAIPDWKNIKVPLLFEGLALQRGEDPFSLRKHQEAAVWRAIVSGKGLFAHEVGTGKTLTIASLAIELRRLRLANKPVLFAHNANSEAVYKEAQEAYPGAKILYVDNLDTENKGQAMASIATEDWDLVIIPHSLVKNLKMRPETLERLLREQMDQLEAAALEAFNEDDSAFKGVMPDNLDDIDENDLKRLKQPTAKELVKERLALVERIRDAQAAAASESTIFIEDMGIDTIMVDEAHIFKKISLATRQQVKGLNKKASKIGSSLLLLSDYIRGTQNGRGVYLFTGTPITNTLNEIYNMQRFIMPDEMQAVGVKDWDGWFNTFATSETSDELSAGGTYEEFERLTSFVNLPELRSSIGQYMDTVFGSEMEEFVPRPTKEGRIEEGEPVIGRPYKQVHNETLEMMPMQRRLSEDLKRRYTQLRDATGRAKYEMMRTREFMPLVINNEGVKLALDPRLMDGVDANQVDPRDPRLKINKMLLNAMEHYNSHPKATQMIFMEIGHSDWTERVVGRDNDGKAIKERVRVFNLAKEIKRRLMEEGVKESEIAIFSSMSKEKRAEAARAMNRGEVRFAIGGTETLGTGVNAQENLVAMHHLDAPWMPGSLEQRNGRGLRQGNRWNTVHEYRYLTEGPQDGRRWQVLLTKDRFISRFMHHVGDERIIDMSDVDMDEEGEGDFEATFSAAVGDPRIQQRFKLEREVAKLEDAKDRHFRTIQDSLWEAHKQSTQDVPRLQKDIKDFRAIQKSYQDTRPEKDSAGKTPEPVLILDDVGGFPDKQVVGADAITKVLEQIAERYATSFAESRTKGTARRIAEYRGVGVFLYGRDMYVGNVYLEIKPSFSSLDGLLRNVGKRIDARQAELDKKTAFVKSANESSKLPFVRQQQLDFKKQKLKSLIAEIEANPQGSPAWFRNMAPVGTSIYIRKRKRRDGAQAFEDMQSELFREQLTGEDAKQNVSYELQEYAVAGYRSDTHVLYEDGAKTIAVEAEKVLNEQGDKIYADIESIRKLKDGDDLTAGLKNPPDVLYQTEPDIDATIRSKALDLGIAANKQGITQFEDFIAYAVDKIGEAQTRRLGNYLTMVGQSVGMKGVRPTKDILGVPLTKDQYVQLAKETFAGSPQVTSEQVEAGIEAAMLTGLPQTAVGFAPAGSPVPGQGLMQGDFDQPADYEFTESDYRPAVVAYARDKWGSEVAANGKPTWQNFVRWFDDSAVVDEDGKPLIVYHGTSRKFDVFDVKKLGEEHGDNSAYLGFYFSEDKGVAKSYGGKDLFVISAFLSIKNPYLMPWEEFEQFEMNEASKEDAIALRKQLIADGYDGIQIEDTPDVVAFWPEQIKSAIANVGTFDPNNPNMLMQQQSQGGNVKGWTKFISGTRALIGATSKADISTVIHEFAHPIRRFLLDKSVPQNKRFDITDEEIEMLEKKCGAGSTIDGKWVTKWDVPAEENFARMWEQYWFEGKSPNSVLDSLFAKISRWMQQVYSSITAITGQPLDPEVRKLFDKLVQRGLTPDQRAAGKKSGGGTAAPVTTSDDPWKQRLTSIANQVAELIRLRLGVPGLTEPSAETFKQWLDEAKQILSNDPTYAERLVKELAQSNRNVDNIDVAVLQIHFRHLNNQLEAASDRLFKAKEENDSVAAAKARLDTDLLVNQIEEFTDITKRAGTEAGRALVARKIALQSDFTLGSLLRKARIANAGEELSEDQIDEITELSKKIAELEGQLEKEIQKNNDLERRLAAEQSIEDTKKEVGKPVRNTATNRASNGAKKFVGLFASIFGKKTDTGTLQQTEDEKMAEAAVELIQGYVDAGVYTFGDFMARFKRDIGMDVPMSAKVAIRKAWDDMKSQGDIPAPEMQEKDSPELRRLARTIQRSVVEAGIVEPDEVIDAVHESLQEVIKDITKRETMDAMSGYGQFYPASKDLNDKIIRDLNSQYQQMAKLDDMRQGMAPKRTGSERPEPSPEVRDLIRQVNEMKRSSKYFVTDEETQLKTIFQATRTALKNRIYDLDKAIREKEPIPGRTPTIFEGEQAKEIESLRKQRDELMAEYKRTFPRPGLTFEQRAAIAERAADRAIAEIEKEIASGKLSVKGRAEPISTPALNAKLARLNALKAVRDAAFESQIKDREKERAEKAYIANLLNRIADYEDRKEHGYFGPRPKKPPRDLSPREKELSKQLENIKDEFFRYAAEYRLKNMTPVQRAWDYTKETMHLSRAIMTSFDLSAVFRQGGIASFAHPKLAASSAKEMYYALRDGQEEFNTMDKISKDELYAIAMQAGLSITTDSGKITRQEEAYMGRWAKWGIGKKGTKINKLTRGALIPVSASARAYTTFLNSMRFRLFKHMVSNLGAGGQVTLDEAKVIASYVNAATGRAELGKFNQAAANLNMVFFAPRYVASRFQYLAMPFYLLPSSKVSGRVKKMIAMEYARFAIGVTSMLGLSVLLGSMLTDDEEEKPTVEFDPRSSDFMKLKIGETRIDPMAGLSQTVTLIGQLATGQKKGLRGDIQDLYGEKRKFGDPDLWDVTTGFLRKKLAPIPGAIVDLRVGENVIGEKETPLTTGLDLFVPLSFQEAGETFQARGLVGGAGVVALSLLGMGGGTYGPRTAYATGDSKKREELFKKDLERVKWDSPDPAYKDFLTTEQVDKFNKQREGRKQALVYAASADPKRKEYVSDESFKQSVAERDKALDAVIKAGMGYEEIKQLLIAYYKRNYGSAYETRGGNYQMKESLTNRLRAIRRKMNEKQPAKT